MQGQIWLIISCLIAAAWTIVTIDFLLAIRSLLSIATIDPPPAGFDPSLTIVIAARDEESSIESTIRSLLNQTVPFQLIAVDDRSTDKTGAIIDRYAARDPRVRALHVTSLPSGWLGKNHALSIGALHATTEWILFTDGDVVFQPETLARVVGYAERTRRDHVTVCPTMLCSTTWLRVAVSFFIHGLSIVARPWRAANPRSKASIGIGAFNLVRREAYEAIGGHQRIAMRPDDDLKLAQLLKSAGYRQEALIGDQFISVEWYPSLPGMVHGLEKNCLSVVNYRFALAPFPIIGMLLAYVLPLATACFAIQPLTRVLGLYSYILVILGCAMAARLCGQNRWIAWSAFIGAFIFCYIFVRSTYVVARDQGIRWRGTLYHLKDIRRGEGPPLDPETGIT